MLILLLLQLISDHVEKHFDCLRGYELYVLHRFSCQLENSFKKKKEFLAAYNSVYRYDICISDSSPSQTSSQSDDFLSNFEKLFDNVHILQPAYSVILGDFNARSKSWWFNDSITMEGTRLDSLV